MLDLVILFTLFIGLVAILALAQQWVLSRGTTLTPLANKRLLDEWLQAHKLELPSIQGVISILNRRLQEVESDVSYV